MFTSYLTLFRTPGAIRFSVAGFIGRMPISMDSLSVILFIVAKTHRYEIAGALTAMGSIIVAIAAPYWSRLSDRFGQRKILLITAPIRSIAYLAFIFAVDQGTPVWSWFLLLACAEIPAVNLGALVRRRWLHALEKREDDHGDNKHGARDLINTAYSLEALNDELIFIFGPVIATAFAISISPSAGILAAIAFLLVGLPLFALQRSTEPPSVAPHPDNRRTPVIRNRIIQAIIASATFVGGYFGSVAIVVVGFNEAHHAENMTGTILGIWAFGSAIAAIINGVVKWRINIATRFLLAVIALTTLSMALFLVNTVLALGVVLFINGFAIAPLIVSAYTVAEQSVPSEQITEALSWVIAGMPLGSAMASAIAGWVIDHHGAHAGLAIPPISMLMATIAILPFISTWNKARRVSI